VTSSWFVIHTEDINYCDSRHREILIEKQGDTLHIFAMKVARVDFVIFFGGN